MKLRPSEFVIAFAVGLAMLFAGLYITSVGFYTSSQGTTTTVTYTTSSTNVAGQPPIAGPEIAIGVILFIVAVVAVVTIVLDAAALGFKETDEK